MGDELVDEVLEMLRDVAFANGFELRELRPAIDTVVNRLRRDCDDDEIRFLLLGDEE
jgi:hypothetical protein